MNGQQQEMDFSRGHKNKISAEMHEKIKPFKENARTKVFNLIDGINSTLDIANILKKEVHKISGRFSELKSLGKIAAIGTKEQSGSKYTVFKKIINK